MAKVITAAEAAELIKDNDVIGSATFGAAGVPESIMQILHIFTQRVLEISDRVRAEARTA